MNKLLSATALFLLAAFITVSIYAIYLHRQIYGIAGWKDEVFATTGSYATQQAIADFRRGQRRLFIIDGTQEKDSNTSRKDGVFEIWAIQYFPILGSPSLFRVEQFTEFYNRKMRYMDAHPALFPPDRGSLKNDTAEQGAAAHP